ncbi:methyl-accepting chemotaxis protein [Lysobacter sp. CFH 32150]|uniref:methyl-accepting chemotaxis protein n=1 Tax=Lysobacter sp. CFH 32150 TaxID=2927128 RepID=UPI001FA7900F|nr:methyl-accepting chemotaxis protein [Lysobacter sp. CFH 32150]MCI4566632.1 methyl-accepting chemotaxis protein [Lysobacter sp. CFH 32150]
MKRNWAFGQKLAAGYAVMVVLVIVVSTVAAFALRSTVASKDRVISVNAQILLDAERMHALSERQGSSVRGYLIAKEQRSLDNLRIARTDFGAVVARLRAAVASEDERRLLTGVEQAAEAYRQVADQIIGLARGQATPEVIESAFEDKLFPARDRLDEQVGALTALEERLLEEAKQAGSDAAATAIALVIGIAVLTVLFAIVIAAILSRTLGRQIGAAVGHVQSSSTELQAAATQQASGAREQATAMSEITTTISELAVTSRQIAESAQRVAQIAEQTAVAARSGDTTVEKGQESIAGIRRQVDLVVTHMLDLGRKSQEIGAVLDIVSELAEQTNILAINATIEATGAGEAGKRFAVVAEEIRKLADRVANSTKQIRTQVDDVRGAVNTTVMATESGAKAVEAGGKQFAEVAASFKQIAGLVATTTDAAREIELSTKQQVTAAEQVRIAVTDVSQATQESEASTSQTLQTASQLSGLSLDLRRLIQPQAASAPHG